MSEKYSEIDGLIDLSDNEDSMNRISDNSMLQQEIRNYEKFQDLTEGHLKEFISFEFGKLTNGYESVSINSTEIRKLIFKN